MSARLKSCPVDGRPMLVASWGGYPSCPECRVWLSNGRPHKPDCQLAAVQVYRVDALYCSTRCRVAAARARARQVPGQTAAIDTDRSPRRRARRDA